MLSVFHQCFQLLQKARPLNRDRLEHRAHVTRPGRTIVAGKSASATPTTVANNLQCWAEGTSPKRRQLLIGNQQQARYVLSWMDEGPRNEDLVELTKPPLGTFVLKETQYDIQGGYWVGSLEERA